MLVYMKEYRNCHGHHLDVVPKSMLSNWMKKFASWVPTLRTLHFHGTKEEQAKMASMVLRHLDHNNYYCGNAHFQVLVPDMFVDINQFKDWFNLDINKNKYKNNLIRQLYKILLPFIQQQLKANLEQTLLPINETILYMGMSKMQKRMY